MPYLDYVLNELKQVKGLNNFNLLSEKDRANIAILEESRNLGVLEAIKKPHALVFTHDSTFRDPASPIVKGSIFPPVPFPEIKAKNVVSSSPSAKVHNYLVRRFSLNLGEGDATLIVGFKL